MLKIYICEENKEHRDKLKEMVNNIILIEDYDMKLEMETDNPSELIDSIKDNKESGIYLLDINLNSDTNGIMLANEIRKYDPRGFIIFITAHPELMYLTFFYKIEAMDYIIKGDYEIIRKSIKDCLENAYNKYITKSTHLQKAFLIKFKDKTIRVNYDKILFFETSKAVHKIVIHCKSRKIEFYGKMKEIQESLDDRFCRCHTSYIVNKDNIDYINKADRIIHMINGDKCLVSIRCLKLL
ncbi:LytTR family DNA-binding domain-containing protein [Clostridium sp. CTA-7]